MMPKVNKILSFKRCARFRHDRQECLPENRPWPGTRCNRCEKFDYTCSASRTKIEEENGELPNPPFVKETIPPVFDTPTHCSLPPSDLHIIGDLHEISICLKEINEDLYYPDPRYRMLGAKVDIELKERLIAARSQAEHFAAVGKWMEAEYICNFIARPQLPCLEPGDLDAMALSVAMNRQIRKFSAAMATQERLVLRLANTEIKSKRKEDSENILIPMYGDLHDRLHAVRLQKIKQGYNG